MFKHYGSGYDKFTVTKSGKIKYDQNNPDIRIRVTEHLAVTAEKHGWYNPIDFRVFPHSFDMEVIRLSNGSYAIYYPLTDTVSRPVPEAAVKEVEERYDLNDVASKVDVVVASVHFRYFVKPLNKQVIVHELSATGGIVAAYSYDWRTPGRGVHEDLNTFFSAVNATDVYFGILPVDGYPHELWIIESDLSLKAMSVDRFWWDYWEDVLELFRDLKNKNESITITRVPRSVEIT